MVMEGYSEAFKVDKKINGLLKRFKITKKNALEWMKFARTIQTSADVILIEAKSQLGLNPTID